ncbi:MAG: glycosyltransferase [Treponemataceae bacterium]|nr:glycosyltransferase [Treponemataceae bacterium]
MSLPILSIVTINYNNSAGLDKTMESVLAQMITEPELFEYIVIDGGSSDNSIEVIKRYLNNPLYNKLISFWCSEKDDGIYNAMNKGLAHTRGKLTGIMNSGDFYVSGALKHAIEIFEHNPEKIQYGVVNKFKDGVFKGALCPSFEYLEESMIPHNATFVPKSYYEKFGYYDENYKILADYDCFLNFYIHKVPFIYSNNIVCDYDLSGVSISSPLVDLEREKILKKYGFYIPPTKIQRIKKTIKKILPFLFR